MFAIKYLTVLLEYIDLEWQGTAKVWAGLCPARLAFGYSTANNDIMSACGVIGFYPTAFVYRYSCAHSKCACMHRRQSEVNC